MLNEPQSATIFICVELSVDTLHVCRDVGIDDGLYRLSVVDEVGRHGAEIDGFFGGRDVPYLVIVKGVVFHRVGERGVDQLAEWVAGKIAELFE